MLMFGITTFMFALGIIALVLETTLKFKIEKQTYDLFETYVYLPYDNSFFVCYYPWATITCLMVRLRDAFMHSD